MLTPVAAIAAMSNLEMAVSGSDVEATMLVGEKVAGMLVLKIPAASMLSRELGAPAGVVMVLVGVVVVVKVELAILWYNDSSVVEEVGKEVFCCP